MLHILSMKIALLLIWSYNTIKNSVEIMLVLVIESVTENLEKHFSLFFHQVHL